MAGGGVRASPDLSIAWQHVPYAMNPMMVVVVMRVVLVKMMCDSVTECVEMCDESRDTLVGNECRSCANTSTTVLGLNRTPIIGPKVFNNLDGFFEYQASSIPEKIRYICCPDRM